MVADDTKEAAASDGKVAEVEPHHHTHEHRRSVINRLSRMEGHLRAIKRMVESDTPCPDVLVQIAAVRSALDQVGRLVLEDHIKGCMVDAVKTGEFEDAFLDLEQSLERFIGS